MESNHWQGQVVEPTQYTFFHDFSLLVIFLELLVLFTGSLSQYIDLTLSVNLYCYTKSF